MQSRAQQDVTQLMNSIFRHEKQTHLKRLTTAATVERRLGFVLDGEQEMKKSVRMIRVGRASDYHDPGADTLHQRCACVLGDRQQGVVNVAWHHDGVEDHPIQ